MIIYLVCKHEGGERVKQRRTPCLQGGEALTHLSTYAKRPFWHAFCYIFIARYFYHTLSLVTTVITAFKTFAMIIFLSLKRFIVFSVMELLPGYLKTFPLEMWSIRWVNVRNEGGGS